METAQLFHRCLRQTLLRSSHCTNTSASSSTLVVSLSRYHRSSSASHAATRLFSTSLRRYEQQSVPSASPPNPPPIQTRHTTRLTSTDPPLEAAKTSRRSSLVDNVFSTAAKGIIDAAAIEAEVVASSTLVSDVLVFGEEKHLPGALLFRSEEAQKLSDKDFLAALEGSMKNSGVKQHMLIPMPYQPSADAVQKDLDGTVQRAATQSRYQKEIDGVYAQLLDRPRPKLQDTSFPARDPALNTRFLSKSPSASQRFSPSLADQLDLFAGDIAGIVPGKRRSDGAYGAVDTFRRKLSEKNIFDQDLLMSKIMAEPTNLPPTRSLRLKPVLGRTVRVAPERYIDVTRAFRTLESKCTQNNVRTDSRDQRTYVRRGQRRKIDKRRRWRALFQIGFMEECGRVRRMRAQGW